MRRAAVVAVLALTIAPAHGGTSAVEATIRLPAPFTPPNPLVEPVGPGPTWFRDNCVEPVAEGRDPIPSCEKGTLTTVPRCLYLFAAETDPRIAQEGDVGTIGYVIAIDPDWVGRRFTLTNIRPDHRVGDFDLRFFIYLGSAQGCFPTSFPDPPITNEHAKNTFARFGNEDGVIPRDTRYAIVVCQCVDARFRFEVSED